MAIFASVGVRNDIWRDASAKDKTTHARSATDWSTVAIAPDDPKKFALTMKVPKSVAEIVIDYKDPAVIGELLFTDAAGVDWVRTHTGELIERRSARWRAGIPLSLSERVELRIGSSSRSKATPAARWARKLGDKLLNFADARAS
jgi:hypothetical protein